MGSGPGLSLRLLPGRFAVCRLPPGAAVTAPRDACLWSLTRTGEETSLVLPEGAVADLSHDGDLYVEGNWRCLGVAGPLDFGLVGVLASLLAPLAAAGVSVFTLSTYDTDYVLVKEDDLEAARRALAESGHRFSPGR